MPIMLSNQADIILGTMENDQTLRRAIISLVNAVQQMQCHAQAANDVLSALPSWPSKEREAMTGMQLREQLSQALSARDYQTKQLALPVHETLRNGTDVHVGLALRAYAEKLTTPKL
jgi:predicted aminopeptidase